MWPKFKLIQVFVVVVVTCKNEDDPFKNEGARVVTTLSAIFQTFRAANSVVGGVIGPNLNSSRLYGCPCYLQEYRISI